MRKLFLKLSDGEVETGTVSATFPAAMDIGALAASNLLTRTLYILDLELQQKVFAEGKRVPRDNAGSSKGPQAQETPCQKT